MPETLPYGSWPSPVTAELIVSAAVSLGEVVVGDVDVWWSELRPSEHGRVAIVRHSPGGESVDVLSEEFSVRTRVHEYGGGAWWLHDATLFFVNWADQRIYRMEPGYSPRPLTPEPPEPHSLRYADGTMTASARRVVCVREHHPGNGQEAVNELVAVDAHEESEPQVLVTGADFVSNPRVSPDGTKLCWLQWHHPAMPWDGTELWVADLVDTFDEVSVSGGRRVAGGTDESIFQPEWTSVGSLLFVSDRSDWWNLHRIDVGSLHDDEPTAEHLAPIEGEIGVAQWVFGQRRYAQLDDGRILCAYARGGVDRLAVVSAEGSTLTDLDATFTAIGSLASFGEGAVVVGASPTTEAVVAVLDVPSEGPDLAVSVVSAPRDLGLGPEWISSPEPLSFPTSGGRVAHALYYPPTNPDAFGPEDDRPPLIVLSHGGPTAAARPQFNPSVQYWTSRGIGVVDVNYGGSTGYGRRFRRQLDGQWGIVDVDDCVAAAEHLAATGEVDPDRLAIRGGSAGGFTTLAALTFRDVFAAGSSHYGVADLEALTRDTHKFESRYLDTLVGPYPQARDRYVERSPIHHTDRLDCPLIVLQGLEDEIVPPEQAEAMVEALRGKGLPFAYLAFEGEQHGFRQAHNIRRALEAELYFFSRVFGFELADPVEPVTIENL